MIRISWIVEIDPVMGKNNARRMLLLKKIILLSVIVLTAGGFATSTRAQGFNAFQVHLLHASGYKLVQDRATTFTGEWANAWRYGDNFAFVDVAWPFAGEPATYSEWLPRLSLSKLSGREISAGPVRDVLLAGNIKSGDGFRSHLAGLGVSLDLPGFNFVNVNGFRRNDANVPGSAWQLNMSWNRTFTTGALHWEFSGFLNWASAEGTPGKGGYSHPNLLTQPQLMLDLGRLLGSGPDRIYAGVEWQVWRNKFGVDGYDESVLQAALKLKF